MKFKTTPACAGRHCCRKQRWRMVELLMELRSLSERCGYEDMRHADDSIRLMESAIRNAEQYCHICLTEAQFDAAGERRDTWICWCRQNRIRLVAPKGEGRYCDRVEEETYEVYLRATYPGLADDAATYGVVGMRRISK